MIILVLPGFSEDSVRSGSCLPSWRLLVFSVKQLWLRRLIITHVCDHLFPQRAYRICLVDVRLGLVIQRNRTTIVSLLQGTVSLFPLVPFIFRRCGTQEEDAVAATQWIASLSRH